MSETGRSRRRFTVDALFTDTRPRAVGVTDLPDAREILLARIVADPDQPRRVFDTDRLDELASSIRSEGVLQPIVVRYDDDQDIYVVVHGERRWRASALAGQTSIPAIVREIPAERRLLQQLMENIVRDDLNAVDRAVALRSLRSQLGDPPWDQVAEAVGIKRSRLFQLLGTGKLNPEAQANIQAGRLSEKQSRLLQGLPEVRQEALRRMLVTDQLSAQVATRIARAFRDLQLPADTPPAEVHAALANLRDLALTDDPQRQRVQSLALLDAIGLTRQGTPESRQRLKRLSSLVATPRFDETRMVKETGSLARSLAALARQNTTHSPEVDEYLRALQHALNAILPADPKM
jgi:ParB family chromosome partitioning protein